jgi:uncharacterized membrane protein
LAEYLLKEQKDNKMSKRDEQKFGLYIFLGFAFGGMLGLVLGAVSGNTFNGLWIGALGGVAIGWFAAVAMLQQNKK